MSIAKLVSDIKSYFTKVIKDLEKYDNTTYCDNLYLYDDVFKAEKACVLLRQLPLYCNFDVKNTTVQKMINEKLLDAHEIVVKLTDKGYPYVKIPRLLPSRSAKNNGSLDFIRAPLQSALNKYVEENGYPVKNNKKSILIIRHGYPSITPEYRCRDHDNYEVKGIIDDISSYFLVDDSIIYCDRLYLSKADDDFYTEIFIVPSCELNEWLSLNI